MSRVHETLVRALAPGVPALFAGSLVALAGIAVANVLMPGLVRSHFPDRIPLLTAVYTDVLDTVSDRGKRTHVTLRGDGPPAKQKRASNVAGGEAATGKTEPFFGRVSLISLEMLTCFKTISDLSADVWGPITPGTTKPSRPTEQEVAERSRQIERKVMSLPPWSDPNTSSSLRVRAFALQEIWRQTMP